MRLRNVTAGTAIEVTRRLVIGREEPCDIVLTDEKVSRRHCALTPQPDGRVVIEDLGSSNGTFVNGERIAGPTTLTGGEEIRAGSTILSAEGEPAVEPTVVSGPRGTVIGAPSTPAPAVAPTAAVGAPSGGPPPPPPPPVPPSGGHRWWRSRWALIGAIAAIAVIGGTVGGVLAATGGEEDEAVATSVEPATVTIVETVAPEPRPETGATVETGAPVETGAVEGTFPSVEETALLEHVPTDQSIQASCERYTDIPEGATAGVVCTADDGTSIFYFPFDNLDSMTPWYDSFVQLVEAATDTGDCVEEEVAEGTWLVDQVEAGRILCLPTTDGQNRLIVWTTNDLLIGLVGAQVGTTREVRQALYDLWASALGPI